MLISEITDTIEEAAPLSLQEPWDNAGLSVGTLDRECTGVMLCVDPTPEVLSEAKAKGCNLVVSHHPLIFKGLKHLTGQTWQERVAITALLDGITLYSAHTNLDAADQGVNFTLASKLGLHNVERLFTAPGVIGDFPSPLTPDELVAKIKRACGSPIARCTAPRPGTTINRLALCGGSGASLIDDALDAGADAFLTSDVKYHDFIDYANRIFIVDIGHFESENCTKQIFYHLVSKKFPNFALYYSENEKNPINYL